MKYEKLFYSKNKKRNKTKQHLTLKMPRKPVSEIVVCLCLLSQTFQTYFCIQTNSVGPDQTASGAVLSGSAFLAYAILSETLVCKGLGHLP